MSLHRIQLDPALLLYHWNPPAEARNHVARLIPLLRLLQDNIAQVPIVCGERLYGQLWICHSESGFHLYERPLENEVKRLIRSFLGRVTRIDEGTIPCEAEIRSQIGQPDHFANVVGLRAAWEASLADACEDGDSRATTVLCDRQFRLVPEAELKLFCLCCDRESERVLDLISEPAEIVGRVGLIDWSAHEVVDPPEVRYEDSGHQPTPRQKAVLEAVVVRTRLISYAGTTYFNPNVGSQESTLRIRGDCGEFEFRVFDSGRVVGGVFRTRASDQYSEAAIFRHVESEFRRQLEKRGLV